MKIVIHLKAGGDFGVLESFSRSFARALKRSGHDIVFWSLKDPIEPVKDADFSLSFFTLFPPDTPGSWDYALMPHVYITVDSIDYFTSAEFFRPDILITLRDGSSLEMMRQMNPNPSLLLPHAAEKELVPSFYEPERPYDISFFCSGTHFIDIVTTIQSQSEKVQKAIHAAVVIYNLDPSLTYHKAFLLAAHNAEITPEEFIQFDSLQVVKVVEMLIRLEDRMQLIKSIKKLPIHMFTETSKSNEVNWTVLFKDQSNIIYHPPMPFEKTFEVMKKSKIILNSSPQIRLGGHERIFYAAQCGALPLTNENEFLKQYYEDEKNILFYNSTELFKVEAKLAKYLHEENLRAKVAEAGRQVVIHNHTWDHRVKTLLESQELKQLLHKK